MSQKKSAFAEVRSQVESKCKPLLLADLQHAPRTLYRIDENGARAAETPDSSKSVQTLKEQLLTRRTPRFQPTLSPIMEEPR
mmetsp:Transcript_15667/g.42231  ORF Transcript_15667/g.42231 Transcript_15667/m.42231 type:complete len:82 (+) Transcript_15667:24-269(+)|eukprot:CAMPEP_0185830366 /NCGR_PEP_ID=MMETSP1353-20130828/805_1 /TAXON_ID=1077150 /ORGANISM="Erythrolobus australicus, Strain CCMP3124" /LENGTH=81 /DNA_ID=CAMNT_0028528261 /DNA_START=23 /DNA_END=268 /DNA_ORIENTATION=-